MLNDLKIRNKLILLVAAPIVIIVLLASLGARSRQSTADDSARNASLVTMVKANDDVVHSLQRESLYSTAFIASDHAAWKTELRQARKATDAAVAQAVDSMDGLQGTSTGFRSTSKLAVDAGEKVTFVRDTVDEGFRWEQAAPAFGAIEESFLAVNQAVTAAVTDPQVASQLRSASALASYKAAVGRQGSLLVGGVEQGGFTAGEQYEAFRSAVAEEASQKAVLDSVVDKVWKADIRDALSSNARNDLEAIREVAVAEGSGGAFTGDAEALTKANDAVLSDLHLVETTRLGEVISASQAESDGAASASNFFIISAALATIIAVAGAIILGRQITIPLRNLTVAADRLATEQMPLLIDSLKNPSDDDLAYHLGGMQDIEVESNDELGKLARSFNDVQRVAAEVATEQAALLRKGIGEMFVNLARRNQALLDRQIEFIDELEAGEEDPDQLENLYRLDHLATRMRRNAESLLVLAGAEPPRRRGRPAPLANVVRAALAEVEDFSRIELLSFDEVLVASNAAADLAHLLSELMENATNFSPPETHVEVVGHSTQADGYVISVTDHGIGMSAAQIIEANEALAKPPLVGLALSRSLGFIVVGRLARRHAINVRMMPSPSGGVTAVVSLPSALVTTDPGYASALADSSAAVPQRLKPVMDTATANSHPDLDGEDHSPIIEPLTFTASNDSEAPAPAGVPAASAGRSGSVFEDSPSRLDEALPTGSAFEAGLESLMGATPEEPVAYTPPVDERLKSLPPRRKGNGGAISAAAAGSATGTHTGGDASGAAPGLGEPSPSPRPGLPEALFFTEASPAAPGPAPSDPALVAPAPPATVIEALPELVVAADPPEETAVGRLDGPPPMVAPPARRNVPRRAVPTPSGAPDAPASDSRPFFLEEAPPPRIVGGGTDAAAPAASPAAIPSTPAPPIARRAPAPAVEAPAVAVEPAAPALTTAGLAKRVPRPAGGARVIPGADGERGVAASKRSPEEVRSLLSQYNAGRARARTEEPVPVGPLDEGDGNE